MADNRVKQIINTVKTTLTNLTTTGANVFIHREIELDTTILPALNIRVGPLVLVNEHLDTQDWELTALVEAYVLDNDKYYSDQMLIQKEVHVAMRADYTLGLSFVHNVLATGFETGLIVSRDKNIVVSQLVHEWNVQFRASLNDISE